MKRLLRRSLRRLGYDLVKVSRSPIHSGGPTPPAAHPIWPLPRAGWSDDEVRAAFAEHSFWHYTYAFEGGLTFPSAHTNPGLDTDDPVRPLQRFRHFMPYVLEAAGGSLKGKRVLDIACNSGFWSIQCALLGAEVVGFDARPELVAQADLLKRITGASGASFRVLDFNDMSPETLGGQFDVVLNLGFLYHAPDPIAVLQRTKAMARRHILLDTAVHPTDDLSVHLKWEEPFDIRAAAAAGVVALPTKPALELMLKHIGATTWAEIPLASADMPYEYLTGRRASWLIGI